MTLKYESEILFDLMKRDGDDTPSDVLPYESELKEKYLEQVEGAYPKLQDYRSEWLNYNLNAHLPADFPVESVSNVTNATFENVVPYAYGSAILSGNTLVNLFDTNLVTFNNNQTVVENGIITIPFRNHLYNSFTIPKAKCTMFKPSTTYTLIVDMIENNGQPQEGETEQDSSFYIDSYDYSKSIVKSGSDGGYTCKIPHRTTGRFIGTFVTHDKDTYDEKTDGILFTLGTYYSATQGQQKLSIILLEGDYTNVDIPYFEGMTSVKMPVLTTTNEDGTKTNILSTSEDVTLRGIGEVQDTLDCLTGQVTQRIGEIVLDGSEVWVFDVNGSLSSTNRFYTEKVVVGDAKFSPSNTLNDAGLIDLPTGTSSDGNEHICIVNGKVYIRKNKTECSDLSTFENWLSSNPITLQYELATKSVKTVDLTVTDQDDNTESIIRPIEGTMHVSTSSQTLRPLLDMSVPVEATTQNLMSFANIVEEEK